MKYLIPIYLYLVLWFSPCCMFGQEILWQTTFDEDPFASANPWFTEDSPSGGLFPWRWTMNGKASAGIYWDDRSAIASPSEGGALVFDSDSLLNVGGIPAFHVGFVLSPIIELTGGDDLYLEFYQYYRNFESLAMIELILPEFGEVIPIYFSELVGKNVETSKKDRVVIHLSDYMPPAQPFQLRFIFQGELYFWLIDDIRIYDAYPYPTTFPTYVGDSLQAFSKPYEVDCFNTPIVPNQLVVQFKPGTTDMDKEALRDEIGVDSFESCMCDQLELWNLAPTVPFDPGASASTQGGSIGIDERKTLASASSKVDGVDVNKYNWHELKMPLLDTIPAQLEEAPGIADQNTKGKIAILDTGIDYEHPLITNFILQETIEDINNCLPLDTIGWNFVDGNNNPLDNHRHGTHLAGIAIQNVLDSTACEGVGILPVKTHDGFGVSDLFDVTCGLYYALQHGASIINCSWGWIGDSSKVLSNVIDSAGLNYNAIIVAAAGNDTINLNEHQQYPACSGQDNVVTVASANTMGSAVSNFSNFSAVFVDIAAYGERILSAIPGGGLDTISGTSMAAPAVAAALAAIYCQQPEDITYREVIDCLLDAATVQNLSLESVEKGRLLQFDGAPCFTTGDTEIPVMDEEQFYLYPNPTVEYIKISTTEMIEDRINVQIYDLQGQLVLQRDWLLVKEGKTLTIDLVGWSSGMYVVKIWDKEKNINFVHKVLLIH